MPELSVCVPVYRAERYIAACARSLFEQTIDDIEYCMLNTQMVEALLPPSTSTIAHWVGLESISTTLEG